MSVKLSNFIKVGGRATVLLIFHPVSRMLNSWLNKKKLFVIWRNGRAIGDQVLMTWAIEGLWREYGLRTVVFSTFPEIFYNNPRVVKNIQLGLLSRYLNRLLEISLTIVAGNNIGRYCFEDNETGNSITQYMKKSHSMMHLAYLHSLHWDRKFKLMPNSYLYVSEQEKIEVLKKFRLKHKKFCLVNIETKVSYTPVKVWDSSKFQEVVSSLPECNWVQVGTKQSEKLNYATDLLGKTSLRDIIVLIGSASIVVSTEGMMNHISSSFAEVTSIVIMSGFSPVEHVQYKNSVFIESESYLECKSCWLTDPCPKNNICTASISSQQVVNILRSVMRETD